MAGAGLWLGQCGKSPSLSQTTKRHVVNKFSIKFKATQKSRKKDEEGKWQEKQAPIKEGSVEYTT